VGARRPRLTLAGGQDAKSGDLLQGAFEKGTGMGAGATGARHCPGSGRLTGPPGKTAAAFVQDHLGDAHLAADDTAAGPQAWQRAFGIFTELDHSKAGDVRAKLARLTAR
jgi:hypothetical protein